MSEQGGERQRDRERRRATARDRERETEKDAKRLNSFFLELSSKKTELERDRKPATLGLSSSSFDVVEG